MGSHKFNPKQISKLENPERLKWLNPDKVASLVHEFGIESDSDVVVEYGCGTGYYTVGLAKHVLAGKVIGLDISTELLEFFRDKIESSDDSYDNIELMHVSGISTPLESDSIDAILAINLLHELEGEWEVLGEMRRILKKNTGRLIAIDWLAMDRPAGPPNDHCLDPKRAKTLLEKAGFRIIEMDPASAQGFPYHYTYILG